MIFIFLCVVTVTRQLAALLVEMNCFSQSVCVCVHVHVVDVCVCVKTSPVSTSVGVPLL